MAEFLTWVKLPKYLAVFFVAMFFTLSAGEAGFPADAAKPADVPAAQSLPIEVWQKEAADIIANKNVNAAQDIVVRVRDAFDALLAGSCTKETALLRLYESKTVWEPLSVFLGDQHADAPAIADLQEIEMLLAYSARTQDIVADGITRDFLEGDYENCIHRYEKVASLLGGGINQRRVRGETALQILLDTTTLPL